MALQIEGKQKVYLFALLGCFLGSSAKLDPNEARLVLYGKSGDDSVEYTLKQAKDLVNDDRFNEDRNTTIFLPGFTESRLKKCFSHHVADAYTETQVANFITLFYGEVKDNEEDLEDVDVEGLSGYVTDFLVAMNDLVDWKTIHLLGYASGSNLTAQVCSDLDKVSDLKPARVSLLDPIAESQDMVKNMVRGDYVDVIHTSAYGIRVPVGLADFFVNGREPGQIQCAFGKTRESKCNNNDEQKCSQRLAWEYWAISVRNGTYSRNGRNVPNRRPYFCGHHADRSYNYYGEPALMGYYSPWTARGTYWVFTKIPQPYTQDKTCQ